MKTQEELIEYYSKNLQNVIIFHGVASDYTSYAFFLLQAVKIGVNFEDIFDWASAKLKSLEDEALESPQLNGFEVIAPQKN